MHLDIVWPGACLKIKLRCQLFQKFWGMKNTETTRYYLRVDLQSLRHCVLDVLLRGAHIVFIYAERRILLYAQNKLSLGHLSAIISNSLYP